MGDGGGVGMKIEVGMEMKVGLGTWTVERENTGKLGKVGTKGPGLEQGRDMAGARERPTPTRM